ncbi:universal stress protein [Aliifodinibius sp. S!AR15-10]|uniref:universal stress protein n=1 Tax=Aliifodinibius sp. S!AR15-10 TaxID=2950437 RepID=UPI0028670CAC|nr:universal stress protein [Aliifodinibius sp. S!AR15-10]MDR8390539.1 universal stress protein [Aliifodinibius sp. S!AR15-10]
MENIKILVPLDFSDLSNQALSAAEEFAKLFDGRITPFHAYLPISEMEGPYMLGLGTSPIEDYEEIEDTLRDRLDEVAREHVEERYLDKAIISVGNAASAIVEEGQNYDMIVMSTHGRTGFSRFFLGSVAEKVLRTSHIPVLVIDKESRIGPIKRILATTDFSENSHAAFPLVKDIARAADAQVELLNVMTYDTQHDEKPDEGKISLRNKRMEILVKEEFHEISDRLQTNVIVSADTPHETIFKHNQDNPADLVVMATVGRTGIEYLMMGSTTANVVRHVKTPVLSINPKKKLDGQE